jgi:hypothetical protein
MATTAKPRRSRSATTGAATEPTATELTATEAVATEATATGTNGAPAATSGSEPTTANGQTTPATEAAATGPDPYVMIVAGQMSGKPDGITGPDLVKAAGLAPGKTAVVLAAMEISGAAIRVPAETRHRSRTVQGLTNRAPMHTVPLSQCPDRQPRHPLIPTDRLEQLHLGKPQRASSAVGTLIFPHRPPGGARSNRHTTHTAPRVGPTQAGGIPAIVATRRP